MKNRTGYFIVSLDFESMWGAIGSKDFEGFESRTRFENEIVDGLIDRFLKHKIHATWGVVGALTCKSKEEMLDCFKKDIFYKEWGIRIQSIINHSDYRYYMPDKVEMLSKVPFVEIASHTFSHAYFNSNSVLEDDANNELRLSKETLSKYGDIQTIIFPRNQVNETRLKLLGKYGYSIYRGTISRLWNNKYLEYLNCYIPLSRKVSYSLDGIKEINGIYNVPASMFLRFSKNSINLFEKLRICRIKYEMRRSAKKNLVFHLWFHPHNLGSNLERGFKLLDEILNYYDYLKKKYEYESLNMFEIKSVISKKEKKTNEAL